MVHNKRDGSMDPWSSRSTAGVILRTVRCTEKKKHLIAAVPFGGLDQMLRTTIQRRGSAKPPQPNIRGSGVQRPQPKLRKDWKIWPPMLRVISLKNFWKESNSQSNVLGVVVMVFWNVMWYSSRVRAGPFVSSSLLRAQSSLCKRRS